MSPQLLTPQETAERLRIHPGTLARWRLINKGPAWIEVEGQYRYSVEEVDKWLQANTRNGENG